MIINILLTYIGAAQLIVLPWIWSSLRGCEVQDDVAKLNSLSGMSKWIAWTISTLLIVVMAPVILPWMLYSVVQCHLEAEREREKFLQLYMELSLEPLHAANIPDELLEHVESFTAGAMSQGCELLGDFYVKDEPYNSKSRILLDFNGIMFVELGRTMETNFIDIISFLENGDFVSTVSLEAFPKATAFAKHGVYVNCGAMDLDQLIQIHLTALDTLSAETGQPIRKIDLPRWKDYFHYHNQKFGEARFEMKELHQPPEKCEFPSPVNETKSNDSRGVLTR